MKAFLQGLLIFFSLCLCVLIAVLWVRETHVRTRLQQLTNTLQDKSENIQNLEGAVRRSEAEIVRLDDLKNNLQAQVETNKLEIKKLTKSLEDSESESAQKQQAIDAYKDALTKANENITRQNDVIKNQNAEMQKLASDRNDIVAKFNKLAADHNDLVTKWNKQQEELAAAATNAPAKK